MRHTCAYHVHALHSTISDLSSPDLLLHPTSLSAHNFSNHFKPSCSQIGKPDSHGRYASQRETPYLLVFLPLYVESHQEEQRTISPLEKTMVQLRSVSLWDIQPSKSNKCLSIAKGFDDYY